MFDHFTTLCMKGLIKPCFQVSFCEKLWKHVFKSVVTSKLLDVKKIDLLVMLYINGKVTKIWATFTKEILPNYLFQLTAILNLNS